MQAFFPEKNYERGSNDFNLARFFMKNQAIKSRSAS
jgi:hypothetical protein